MSFDKYLDAKEGEIAAEKTNLKREIAEIDALQAKERQLLKEAQRNSYSNPKTTLLKTRQKFLISFWSVVEIFLKYRIIIYMAIYLALLQFFRFLYIHLKV